MGGFYSTLRRQGYENLDDTALGPELMDPVRLTDQEPTDQEPTDASISTSHELTAQAPPDSNVKVTIGGEGWEFSRRRDSGYALRVPKDPIPSSVDENDISVTVRLPHSAQALPDSCIRVTIGREGWVFSQRGDSGYTLQMPKDSSFSCVQEVDLTVAVDPSSQEPTINYWPLSRTIQELTDHTPRLPSDKVTIGRDGCTLSRKEDKGFALQIPKDSFQDDVDVEVNVFFPDPETHFVPEGSELVSGVCHIDSVEIELIKGGSLVINHCINIRSAGDRDSVRVVTHNGRKESSGCSGSNEFQYVDDCYIVVKSDSVVVTLKKLGSMYYAVTCAKERCKAVGYCGMLYRQSNHFGFMKFFFMVIKDLNIYIKAVEDDCAARNLEKAYEPMPITFEPVPEGQEMKLTLDIKEGGKQNKKCHIYPCTWPAEIHERDAYNFHPKTCRIPSIELRAQRMPQFGKKWLGFEWVQIINIQGTRRPKSLVLQYEPGQPYFQESTEVKDHTVPKMSQLIKCVGLKNMHNIPEEIGVKYTGFGILLLDDKTCARVRAIEREYQSNSEAINIEILRRWLQGRGKKPVQWQTLIGVLKDIEMLTLAEDIEDGLVANAGSSF